VSEIRVLLQNSQTVLEQLVQRTLSLRGTNPRVRTPRSVFDDAIGDTASIFTVSSTPSSNSLAFDGLIISSSVYRQRLAAMLAADRPEVNDTDWDRLTITGSSTTPSVVSHSQDSDTPLLGINQLLEDRNALGKIL
jgi:hypothetical protein